eukprot:1176373-Prorocentrum_minimum.AAC.1
MEAAAKRRRGKVLSSTSDEEEGGEGGGEAEAGETESGDEQVGDADGEGSMDAEVADPAEVVDAMVADAEVAAAEAAGADAAEEGALAREEERAKRAEAEKGAAGCKSAETDAEIGEAGEGEAGTEAERAGEESKQSKEWEELRARAQMSEEEKAQASRVASSLAQLADDVADCDLLCAGTGLVAAWGTACYADKAHRERYPYVALAPAAGEGAEEAEEPQCVECAPRRSPGEPGDLACEAAVSRPYRPAPQCVARTRGSGNATRVGVLSGHAPRARDRRGEAPPPHACGCDCACTSKILDRILDRLCPRATSAVCVCSKPLARSHPLALAPGGGGTGDFRSRPPDDEAGAPDPPSGSLLLPNWVALGVVARSSLQVAMRRCGLEAGSNFALRGAPPLLRGAELAARGGEQRRRINTALREGGRWGAGPRVLPQPHAAPAGGADPTAAGAPASSWTPRYIAWHVIPGLKGAERLIVPTHEFGEIRLSLPASM